MSSYTAGTTAAFFRFCKIDIVFPVSAQSRAAAATSIIIAAENLHTATAPQTFPAGSVFCYEL